MESLNFLLLGEEVLLQRCADEIHKRGHKIVGVISENTHLRNWSQSHRLPCHSPDDYEAHLDGVNYDVLASITHPQKISDALIQRAKILAINYHDGPLPRYAGINASSWAIYNGEQQHGIVWHKLASKIDSGDILEREQYTIEPNETSLSINIKNSVLALNAFKRVLSNLEQSTISSTTINPEHSRSFYYSYQRPGNFGIVDWSQSTAKILGKIHACFYGDFPNYFAVAKLGHQIPVYFTSAEEVTPSTAVDPKPGQIYDIDNSSLTIGTNDSFIRIFDFYDLFGHSINDITVQFKPIEKGTILDCIKLYPEAAEKNIAKAERYYRHALLRSESATLPLDTAKKSTPPLKVQILESSNSDIQAAGTQWALALSLVISNLTRNDKFRLSLKDAEATSKLICTDLPINIELKGQQSVADNLSALHNSILETRKKGAFLWDLISREPALRREETLSSGRVSDICICFDSPPSDTALLSLVVESSGVYLYSNGSFSEEQLLFLKQLTHTTFQQISTAQAERLNSINVLSDADIRRILFARNSTSKAFPETLRLTDLFKTQVKRVPDKCAVIVEEKRYTYLELDILSDKVAYFLQERKVVPGSFIAIHLSRSIELLAALLGVIKAGAAYIPLDTYLPPDRILSILNESKCSAVITSDGFFGKFPEETDKLDIANILRHPEPVAVADNPASANDICYTIFTSGSTGAPKGVVLKHKAVINTLDWVIREFQVQENDTLLFVTSPGFDLSVFDVFGTLSTGATIRLATERELQDPSRLVEILRDEGITIWDSAPPALVRLEPLLKDVAVDSRLRLVMLSGDWIPIQLPDKLKSVFPNVKVKSLGGATEAAIWSNYYHVDTVKPEWKSIPYGYPIQNAYYYILDHHLRPVPDGIHGDLYIGGVCLAEGYLNRADLTNERFIENPHIPGDKIYKTGDLAKYWLDGTMEFLGRSDFQVKVRGYRIELEEIEAIANSLDDIIVSRCVASKDANGSVRLILYIVPSQTFSQSKNSIKAQVSDALETKLPDYMVPGHVILLDELPLTPNGKLDTKSLPQPDLIRGALIPPSTPTEKGLVEIWKDLLPNVDSVSIEDNFFTLGGDSILAVNLIARINQKWSAKILLSQLIISPTIAKLSEFIDQKCGNENVSNSENSNLILLREGGSKNFYFIYDGDGEILLYKALADILSSDYTFYGILPKRTQQIPQLACSIPLMAADCIEIIKQHQHSGPYYFGGLCAGGVITFEMTRQLINSGDQIGKAIIFDAAHPRCPRNPNHNQKRRAKSFKLDIRQLLNSDISFIRKQVKLITIISSKVYNLLNYEIQKRITQLQHNKKLEIYKEAINGHAEWPADVEPISIRAIYERARDTYGEEKVSCEQLLLIKSQAKEFTISDEPMSEMYSGDFLGWEKYITSGKIGRILTEGGHSSMLQRPYLNQLAIELNIALLND